MQRTHSMVFVGDGSSEDGPEAIPSDKADVTLDPLDLHAHQVEEPTEYRREHLRIEGLRQG